jgi:hypothetical protein
LKSANLYSARDGFGYTPSTDPHFPVDGKIIFTFVDLPEGAVASAAFTDGTYAPAVIDSVNNTVTITPALLTPNTPYTFTLRIVRSATEPYTLYESPAPTGGGVVGPLSINAAGRIQFTTAPSELVPVSTNLYTDRSGFAYTPSADAHFPVDSDIVITFADIPAGAVAKATFTDGTYAPAVVDAELNTVTISPAQLAPNAAKTFTLDIIKSTAEPYVLYRNPAGSGVVVGPLWINNGILFTPATSELTLVSTNLYIDRDGIQQTPANTAIFAGDAIEFTFNNLPTAVVIVTDLQQGTTVIPADTVRDGNKITITPVQLKRSTAYTLDLQIRTDDSSQRTLYKPVASPSISLSGDRIQFTTAAVAKVADLIGTNLYINPETTVDTTPAANLNFFAVDDDIVLTFGSPVPTGTVISVQLRDAKYNLIKTTNTTSATDRTLTINPDEDLKPSATYYLWARVMDTTDAEYWAVLDTTNGVALSQPFTASGPGPDDSKYYIGFSTQKDQAARLISANLYLDGNPAYYTTTDDGPYFLLDGSIVLTFADIPDGTRISKAILATSPAATSGLSVYSTLVTDATTKVTTVTIKPNAKLDANTIYHLQLELSKTVGATDPVWKVTAADSVTGIHGPVYVTYSSASAQAISFKTITAFGVVPNGGSSLTNLINFSATPNGNFDATGNIVIEFDRPIETVTKAQLRYYRGAAITGEYLGITISADNNDLSPDKTVLTIAPSNLLAPSSNFALRLDVTSVDGQQIVYDSTNTGDPSAWANGSGYFGDLNIVTSGTPRLSGISKQAVTGGTLAVPGGNLSKTADTVDLTFTAVAANFAQTYEIFVRRYDLWNTTALSQFFALTTGVTAPTVNPVQVDIPPTAGFEHFNAENIQYKVRGINNQGYVIEQSTRLLTFNQ